MFAFENNETISIPSLTSLVSEHDKISEHSKTMKADLWYQPSDLAGFRDEVRNLCRSLRCPQQHSILLKDGSIRGLESRLCPERKRRKFVSNRCIVHAAKKTCVGNLWDAERLAALCQKINEWSTELAVIQGARDFDRAWRDGRKRVMTGEMDQPRCIRQRFL